MRELSIDIDCDLYYLRFLAFTFTERDFKSSFFSLNPRTPSITCHFYRIKMEKISTLVSLDTLDT